jgi:hypothetical protein
MRLRHIEVIQAILQTGHPGLAAEWLQLSVGDVDAALKEAEAQLGFMLFASVRGRLQATRETLELQAEIAHLRVPVSSLCIAAAVPATTALRWLKTMVQQGIFVRRADPHDGRRVFVELAPESSQAMRRYFAEVGQVIAI